MTTRALLARPDRHHSLVGPTVLLLLTLLALILVAAATL